MAGQTEYYETPNLIVVCLDDTRDEIYKGRLYHFYSGEPIYFANALQMIKRMEELYDLLCYPQASTQDRYFIKRKEPTPQEVRKVSNRERIMKQKGEIGTFVVRVQYRQNSTWQGQVTWAEGKETISFRSVLELLKLMDNVMNIEECREGEENGHEKQ